MPIYNNCKEQLLLSSIPDLSAAGTNIKVALVSGYTPNVDTHQNWSDVSASDESGTGYTAGGKLLTGKAVTQEDATDHAKFDAADTTWTALNVGTPSHAILYYDSGTPSTSTLIGYWAVTTASNGGDYTLAYDSAGILTLT